jgi:hypothetical protein
LGITSREDWKLRAYEEYRAKLCASDYPCFFGQTLGRRLRLGLLFLRWLLSGSRIVEEFGHPFLESLLNL